MKYLLLLAIVLLVVWLFRSRQRTGRRGDAAPRAEPDGTAEPMVVCAHCGVHLPRSDALPGRDGLYCGEAHRVAHETARE